MIGISAAAAFAQFVPAANAAPAHQGKGPSADAARSTAPKAVPAIASGCTASSSPDYGCGKLTVEAQPVASTYPIGASTDLTGLIFDIAGAVAANDTPYDGLTTNCDTVANGTGSDNCPESDGVEFTPPAASSSTFGTWIPSTPYTVTLDTSGSNKAAPANTLIPPVTGNFPDCTTYQGTGGPTTCPDAVPVYAYGTYHHIGLLVENSVTRKGAAKAGYALCSPTTTAPTLPASGCPSGSSVLATATSNSKGVLVFPSVYLGSPNYSIVPTATPTGYNSERSLAVDVPAVTTVAQAGTLVAPTTKLVPITTTAVTHTVHVKENKRVKINAFAHAKHAFKPLTLIKIGHVKHGTVHHKGGTITFTPKKNFVGKVTFTYTIRNAVGVTSKGKIVVHVKP